MSKSIKLTNVRENNLKGISLEIPHDQFCVITGLSGSGKSSLAFDTIYAEGQRRYLETFSSYIRQFFDLIKKPDADLIQNVRPAVAIEQKTKIKTSRSTVGSVSGINDYLKILWNYLSKPICPACDTAMDVTESKEVAVRILSILSRHKESVFVLCSPIDLDNLASSVKKREQALKSELERLKILGSTRVFIPETRKIEELDQLEIKKISSMKTLYLVIERIKFGSHKTENVTNIVEQAYTLSPNRCKLIEYSSNDSARTLLRVVNSPNQENIQPSSFREYEFKNIASCKYADTNVKSKRTSLFSYNHPYGACENCRGFGSILVVDQKKCVPDSELSINEGAISCWAGEAASGQFKKLLKFCFANSIDINLKWSELPAAHQTMIFDHSSTVFRGVKAWFKMLERKIYKTHVRVFISRYRTEISCPECQGSRFNKSALSYKISGLTIAEVSSLPISELRKWVSVQYDQQIKLPRQIKNVFAELNSRLGYLEEVGLPYLTLNRQSNSLSGGETQRVNLASAIGSNLVSTQFVLDEPTVGLHSRDTARLIKAIKNLKSRGNSVLVVEHDLDVINEADHIIEVGPGAGNRGGQITFNGPRKDWAGISTFELQTFPERRWPKTAIKIKNASARNLKNVTLEIPLHKLVAISGVSGSGKSTLLEEVIVKGYEFRTSPSAFTSAESISGFEHIDNLVLVDQSPISKTPRGNIATYSGIWDEARKILAATADAHTRKLTKSSFSFNVDAGRCPDCKGAGFIKEDMQFLSDVYIPCDSCLGKRFQQIVLEVAYQGRNVADILNLSVEDALVFFEESSNIKNACQNLIDLGLGYLRLGHPLSELSGGEAQRLKLVSYISNTSQKHCLFLFDEPTTGLHVNDIAKLIAMFRSLVQQGHSIITVEHNLTFLNSADWLIDMGPDGGEAGGRLLFEGTPEALANNPKISHSAYFMNSYRALKDKKKDKKIVPFHSPHSERSSQVDSLRIIGAREHNLKNVDLSIPLNEVVVFSGVSGSGKSSLAKDIIYAEGQRSYLDCLSPYARQFIRELKQPDLDSISGVPPTICVYQHTYQPGRHSTVGTMSEIYNYLRLLFAKIGVQHCPDHPDEVISPASAEEIASKICSDNSSNIKILSPIIKGKKGFHKDIFERALELEIGQVRVDGKFGASTKFLNGLDRNKAHTIEYLVASFNPKTASLNLVEEAVTQALRLGAGSLITVSSTSEEVFSTSRTCPVCTRGFLKPDPEDLSFSSRRGRCLECEGIGTVEGTECQSCNGARLSELGRNIRVNKQNIHELSLLSLDVLKEHLLNLRLSAKERLLSDLLIKEAVQRIDLMIDFGLEYLPLYRHCSTLSGGELQRLRLAAALGSNLSGVMYILDEPTSGLHPIDSEKIVRKVRELKGRGNSLVIIEHDRDTILNADYIVDVGPCGGREGGHIVYQGPIHNFLNQKASLTAQAIKSPPRINIPKDKLSSENKYISISGSLNNIKDISVKIPCQRLVGVIGVSGAGKSTLVERMFADTVAFDFKNKTKWSSDTFEISTTEPFSSVHIIDQKPLGKNSRSVPASYLGIWDGIRKVFAMTPEAKSRGWKENFFSFNSGKGRCPECKGMGEILLEMNFLPSAKVPCERCKGKRFTEEACTIKYSGASISDVLAMTIEEAKLLFANHKKIYQLLASAVELGVGYITLGQSTTTLSGGEAQRLKLALELAKPRHDNSVYVLDEPTSGLHMTDVSKLIKALHELVRLGHSVIVIEHDSLVIESCHHIIELGPGPGEEGGNAIFEGSYSKLLKAETPWGRTLRENALLSADRSRSILGDKDQSSGASS